MSDTSGTVPSWLDVDAPDGTDFGLDGDSDVGNDVDLQTGQDIPKAPCDFPADDLCPCAEGADCALGFCVYGDIAKFCLGDALDCPNGMTTVPLQRPGRDPMYVCQSSIVHLCQPCVSDADCDRDGACLDFGDEGHFCGTACGMEGPDCPSGFVCTEGQCRPKSKQCACNPFGIDHGLSTTCTSTTTVGQCNGTRRCTEAGLSACSAATPIAEACNGLDDDCNGVTDDCSDGESGTENDTCAGDVCIGTPI